MKISFITSGLELDEYTVHEQVRIIIVQVESIITMNLFETSAQSDQRLCCYFCFFSNL